MYIMDGRRNGSENVTGPTPGAGTRRDRAENMRKLHTYRRLILTRRLSLSRSAAVGIVGPDCAYHLYRVIT